MPDVIRGFIEDGVVKKYDYDSLANNPVVATIEDMYNTTSDEVTVLKDDSYYGSGQTVTFMKSENTLHSSLNFLQRANGDYMVPKPGMNPVSSEVPSQAIGEVVASYINHPEIVYGGTGAFCDTCDSEMDCSILSQLVFQGISYDKSKYSGLSENIFGDYVGGNVPKNKASLVAPRRTSGYLTSEQAMWFAQQNRLYYIDYTKEHPCSQLQVGDIVFESGENHGADSYLYIHHVAVVLAVYPESDRIVVAQSGGFDGSIQEYTQIQGTGTRRDNIKITTLKVIDSEDLLRVYARPLYGKAERKITSEQSQVYYNESATIQTSGTDAQVAQIFLRRALDPHKMYTFAVKGTLPQYKTDGTNIQLSATINGNGITLGTALHIDCGDVFSFSFVPPSEIADATALRARVFVSTLDPSLDTPKTYELDGFSLYEGLWPSIAPNNEKIDDPFVVETGVTGSREAWMEDGKLHIHGSFVLPSAVSSDSSVKIATLNPDYFGLIPLNTTVVSATRRFLCFYNGDPHMALLTSSGELKVYYKNGEGTSFSTIFDVVI